MSDALRAKWDRLIELLKQRRRVLVAFSGGCDSALLLAAARRALGKENVLAVTAVSASLPELERQRTMEFAAQLDAPHRFLDTRELENSDYASNPPNRCFFCKQELFSRLAPVARTLQMALADGFNRSDRADYRPGFQASQEWDVIHPLDDADLSKREIRALSRWLGLPTWNKPASPCLSSRIPYGTAVTRETLAQIERAEQLLHEEGFRIVRVRHYGPRARIEVPVPEIPFLKEAERWKRISLELKRLGYAEIEVEPSGFQSGRLNQVLVLDV